MIVHRMRAGKQAQALLDAARTVLQEGAYAVLVLIAEDEAKARRASMVGVRHVLSAVARWKAATSQDPGAGVPAEARGSGVAPDQGRWL